MVNITFAVSEQLHEKMQRFPEVKWSEVARRAIEKKAEDLEFLNKIAEKSKLTKEDVEQIGERIKSAAAKRFAE